MNPVRSDLLLREVSDEAVRHTYLFLRQISVAFSSFKFRVASKTVYL